MKARTIIIPVSIIVGVAAIGIAIAALGNAASAVSYTETSELEKKTLSNSIAITGTVESTNMSRVYANLSYPVEAVNVQVGDTVKKGDILCTLNTDELQNQILQQQATIDNSNISSNYQVTDAEKKYQEALGKSNDGTDSQIVNAIQSMENAKLALDKAQFDYDNALDGKNLDTDTQIKTAELSLKNAEDDLKYYQDNYKTVKKTVESEDYYSIKEQKQAYDDAKKEKDDYKLFLDKDSDIMKNYEDAKTIYEKAKKSIDDTNSDKLDSALQSVKNAEKSVENAKLSLESAKDTTKSSAQSKDDAIANYKSQLANAQLAYENAKNNYNLAVKDSDANLATLKSSAERERTLSTTNDAQVILLESYKAKLEDTIIVAACDGTITSVNAVVGSVPNGVLFVIEDTDNLKINASVSEYDIALLKTGMPVTIKTDAISGAQYDGLLSKIAPTASKSADGTNSGTGTFGTEISVLSKDTALKIGMTAKLSIITEEKSDVFAVMYDTITTDENGNDIIYIAEKTDSGYKAKALIVTVGMETDFEAEISGDGLTIGTLILTDNTTLYDGAPINIKEVSDTEPTNE